MSASTQPAGGYVPIPLHQAEHMLDFVDSHEREVWVQVGKALASEYGDQAADAFDRWSAQAANYDERAVRTTWRSCLRKPGGYTMGTIVALAKAGGYQFERVAAPPQEELARRREEKRARMAAEAARRAAEALQAEHGALAAWRGALRVGRSPYAERKGIERPEACRFSPAGWLLVPMLRYDLPREQSLKGLQIIQPDGSKKFTYGMAKAGTACRLGLAEVGAPVLLCEGWATGMSLRMATGRRLAVYVAFDAGNLEQVALMVAELHPGSALVLCADDDWRTLDREGRPLNPGRVAAAAAREVLSEQGATAVLVFPHFPPAAGRQEGDTDFNDLHQRAGVDEVARQVATAIEVAEALAHG